MLKSLLRISFFLTLSFVPLSSYESVISIFKEKSSKLTEAVEHSLYKSIQEEAPPLEGIYAIHGMSGRKYRFFINTLIANLDNPSYLEIGTWAGSTLCSAVNGNKVHAVAIDNWSEFGGPRDLFLKNINAFITPRASLKVIEDDFRNVDYSTLGTFNVYLFDGPHSEKDQYDGLNLALKALENEFIFIVDDWNWPQVRKGTLDAIKNNHLTILYSAEIRTTTDDSHPSLAMESSLWHNGYYIAVLSKENL